MVARARVSRLTSKAVFCTVLGALPLVLDGAAALGSAWPRGTLPAGMSRLALAFLPWFVLFGAPLARGRLAPAPSEALPLVGGLLLGLPLFAFAGASDLAAGLPLGELLGAGAAALAMLLLLCNPRPVAAGEADSAVGSGYRDLAWFGLVLVPVMIAMTLGLVRGGAPLAPDEAAGWLSWSPLGWCLLWAAENPDLEPRPALAPFGALAIAVAVRAAALVGRRATAATAPDLPPASQDDRGGKA